MVEMCLSWDSNMKTIDKTFLIKWHFPLSWADRFEWNTKRLGFGLI